MGGQTSTPTTAPPSSPVTPTPSNDGKPPFRVEISPNLQEDWVNRGKRYYYPLNYNCLLAILFPHLLCTKLCCNLFSLVVVV
jgi:hypothetical protein